MARHDPSAAGGRPGPDGRHRPGAASGSGAALHDLDLNHYIRRRRIQQYGPRLDKPYPFYDWVPTARAEIAARGDEAAPPEEPDPRGRIVRDSGEFVEVERLVVPTRVAPGDATRAHVVFRPDLARQAHWNNEVDDLVFWVDPPPAWGIDTRCLTAPRPASIVSQETRCVEFELRVPPDAPPGPVTVPGYALYHVCEDVGGTCLYRRQDVT